MPNKTIVAIGCITAIIITALIMGVNGVLVSTGIGSLAGLGGYIAGRKKKP